MARVNVNTKGLDAFFKKLEADVATKLKVGSFGPASEYAVHNEFGTRTIPERSFIRSTLAKHHKKYQKMTKELLQKLLQGGDAEALLGSLGDEIVKDIQMSITNFDTPPNAPSTILQKGFNAPLEDSGALLASIDWRFDES